MHILVVVIFLYMIFYIIIPAWIRSRSRLAPVPEWRLARRFANNDILRLTASGEYN